MTSSRPCSWSVARALCACLMIGASLSAAERFVALNGNDVTGDGSLAKPWRTITRASQALQPGDICYVRAGTYRETVRPAGSGTASAPITFARYGNEQVTVSGADPVRNWTLYQGSIYQATADLPVNGYNDEGFLANQVFVDGAMMTEARWPNTGTDLMRPTLGGGGVSDENATSTNSVVTNAELPDLGSGWIGATVWCNEWFVSRSGTVTGVNADKSLNATMTAPWGRGAYWFYMTGAFGLLDSPREWFYDGAARKLYLWSQSGETPNNLRVEAKRRNLGFDLADRSFIAIRGINLFACTISTSAASAGVVIDRMTANYVSHHVTLPQLPAYAQAPGTDNFWVLASHCHDTGIQLRGTGHTLRNSTVAFSSGNGVLLEGTGHLIENNRILVTNYQSTYAAGVRLNGGGHKILRNTMAGTGRDMIVGDWHTNGLSLRDVEIGYNDISGFGALSSDLGAIYFAAYQDMGGGRIHHNSIHDPYWYSNFWDVAGIYFDLESYNGTIDHNVMWNFNVAKPAGLKLGSPRGLERVFNNTALMRSYIGEPIVLRNNLLLGDTVFAGPNTSNNLFAGTVPRFANPALGDFSLLADSPAIDQGVGIAGFTDDQVGAAPDIGAFEFGQIPFRAGVIQGSTSNTIHTVQTPAIVDADDGRSYELGMRFVPEADGALTAIRYFKALGETGEHIGRIWSDAGVQLASVAFTSETAWGWQQQALPTPLLLTAGTSYVVSVNANTRFAVTVGGCDFPLRGGLIHAPANGANGLFGDLGAFPTSTFRNSNYFRDVRFTPDMRTLPSPWKTTAIAAAGGTATGSAAYLQSSAQFTVVGGGAAGIGGTQDEMRLVHQELPVDGVLTAQLIQQGNTGTNARAGLMLRASLAADAPYVALVAPPAMGVALQHRSTAGGPVTSLRGAARRSRWLRLERSAGTVTASESPDGTTWTVVGSVPFPAGGSPLIGLVVTSGSAAATSTAIFGNVQLRSSPPPLAVPPVGLADAYVGVLGTTLTVAAPGVLANDSGPLGFALSAQLVGAASKGTVTVAADGGFVYVPNSGAFGADSFSYRVSTTAAAGNTVTVSLRIGRPNTWDGEAGDGLWATLRNWETDTLPTANPIFPAEATAKTVDLGGDRAFQIVTIGGGYTLSGGRIAVEGGGGNSQIRMSGNNVLDTAFGTYGGGNDLAIIQAAGGSSRVSGSSSGFLKGVRLVSDGTLEISGTIAPPGGYGFVSTGTGIVRVSGAINGAPRGRRIEDGILVLNGTANADGTWLVDGGTLAGLGSLASAVTVGGAAASQIAPGDPAVGAGLGTLSITGNVTVARNGGLYLQVGAAGSGDLLAITGDLILDPSSAIAVLAAPGAIPSGSYTLVRYSGALSGTCRPLALPSGYALDFSLAGEIRLVPQAVVAANMIFPADAGILNVTLPPYNAVPNDGIDDTAAIQAALEQYPNDARIIYLPNGVYDVSTTLTWPAGRFGATDYKNTIMQGQSRDGTIIRLRDAAPGFTDPAAPAAVVFTGPAPAQRFRNAVRDLTIDVGAGNPGADALRFNASNQGTVDNVRLVAAPDSGAVGLNLGFTAEIGPLLVNRVEIDGFRVGISTADAINGITLEHITVRNQREAGIYTIGQMFAIRDFTSINAVPALINGNEADRDPFGGFGGLSRGGMVVLIDAQLVGLAGAASQSAIRGQGRFFVRNATSIGYERILRAVIPFAVQSVEGSTIAEFTSHPGISAVPGGPTASLNLPVRETPDVAWGDPATWTNIVSFGAVGNGVTDDSAAFQAAIDSGAHTVYIPAGPRFVINGTVILRGAVRRLIGTEGEVVGSGVVRIEDGSAPVVVIERSIFHVRVDIATDRTVVLKNLLDPALSSTGGGQLFISDVVCSVLNIANPAQQVWARQFNVESGTATNVSNAGGTLWILGMKTERAQTKLETTAGGTSEVLGAHVYITGPVAGEPLFSVVDSRGTFAGIATSNPGFLPRYDAYVREEIAGAASSIVEAQTQSRTAAGGQILVLGTALSAPSVPVVPRAPN